MVQTDEHLWVASNAPVTAMPPPDATSRPSTLSAPVVAGAREGRAGHARAGGEPAERRRVRGRLQRERRVGGIEVRRHGGRAPADLADREEQRVLVLVRAVEQRHLGVVAGGERGLDRPGEHLASIEGTGLAAAALNAVASCVLTTAVDRPRRHAASTVAQVTPAAVSALSTMVALIVSSAVWVSWRSNA